MPKINEFMKDISSVYQQQIQKMFRSVKAALQHLLNYLTFMYSAHGINYDVTNLLKPVFRILTPFQLCTYFNCYDATQLLEESKTNQRKSYRSQSQSNFSKKVNNQDKNDGYFLNNQKIQKFQPISKSNLIDKIKTTQQNMFLHPQKNIYLQQDKNIRNKQRNQGVKSRRKNIYRVYNGGRPILTIEQQNKVKQFMINQVRRGKILTMKMIAEQAKKIAKNTQYFLASDGWVKNFLKRHPDMRQLYKKSRTIKSNIFTPNNLIKSFSQHQNDHQDNSINYTNNFNMNKQQFKANQKFTNNIDSKKIKNQQDQQYKQKQQYEYEQLKLQQHQNQFLSQIDQQDSQNKQYYSQESNYSNSQQQQQYDDVRIQDQIDEKYQDD